MYQVFGKRVFDFILLIFVFIILLPLFFILFLAILIFGKNKVIFKQKRIGHKGKVFIIYKIRTMPIKTLDIPSDKLNIQKDLNFWQKFLRRTNIDELPQLYNIFKNELSFVGPRPALPSQSELNDLRKKNINCYNAKPGITGLSQIKAYDNMTYEEKARYDIIYTNNINFYKDIEILFKTVGYLLKKPPIY